MDDIIQVEAFLLRIKTPLLSMCNRDAGWHLHHSGTGAKEDHSRQEHHRARKAIWVGTMAPEKWMLVALEPKSPDQSKAFTSVFSSQPHFKKPSKIRVKAPAMSD
jgi:hypothetical protein